MPDAPAVQVVPPLRCQHQNQNRGDVLCGRPAEWMRPGTAALPPRYFCGWHKRKTDVAVPETGVFRRVSVTVQVLISGASWTPRVAESEAVEQVRAAVERVGGVSSLVSATSHVVRWALRPPVGEAIAVGDHGE